MLKALLAAILVALVVLIYLLMVPSSRLEHGPLGPGVVNGGPAAAGSSFVIHNDAPPTTAPPPATTPPATALTIPATPSNSSGFTINGAPAPVTPPDTGDNSLDAVMQRLRSAKPDATVTVTPGTAAAPGATTATAPAAVAAAPVQAPPVSAPDAAPEPVQPQPLPPPRWTGMTGQGVQFRITPAPDGLVISIDLGGGHVAQVHALPAFGRLDPAAINTRVDYLKQTILENFPYGSGSYLFNRDGSLTRLR